MKFLLGLVFVGFFFVLLMLLGLFYGIEGWVSLFWLFFSFFIMIVGEMCLFFVGLLIIIKLVLKVFEV